jgi:hypothetical protein
VSVCCEVDFVLMPLRESIERKKTKSANEREGAGVRRLFLMSFLFLSTLKHDFGFPPF